MTVAALSPLPLFWKVEGVCSVHGFVGRLHFLSHTNGVVHAWVGQIVLNCNVFLRRNSSVPPSDDLSATRQLAEATADLS